MLSNKLGLKQLKVLPLWVVGAIKDTCDNPLAGGPSTSTNSTQHLGWRRLVTIVRSHDPLQLFGFGRTGAWAGKPRRCASLCTALAMVVLASFMTPASSTGATQCSGNAISGSLMGSHTQDLYSVEVPPGATLRVVGTATPAQSFYGGWDAGFNIVFLDGGGQIRAGRDTLIGGYYANPPSPNGVELTGQTNRWSSNWTIQLYMDGGTHVSAYSLKVEIRNSLGHLIGCTARLLTGRELANTRHALHLDDPVNTSTGNFWKSWEDMAVPSQVLGGFARTYNSFDPTSGVLGTGWSTWLDAAVEPDATLGELDVSGPDGALLQFPADGAGGYVRDDARRATIATAPGGDTVTFDNGDRWDFDAANRLIGRTDGTSGQTVAYTRNGAGVATGAVSSSGQTLSFGYDGGGRLTSMAAGDGRSVTYGYGAGGLVSVTRPDTTVETYGHDGAGYLTSVTDPLGHVEVANTFDGTGRVLTQVAKAGSNQTFAYDDAANKVTETDSATGDVTTVIHNGLYQATRVTDAAGRALVPSFDDRGNQVNTVDRAGRGGSQSFDAHNNVLSTTTPDGATRTFTYDASDRLTSATDGTPRTTTYAYTGAQRIPATVTDPAGKITTVASAAGLVTGVTDADGVVTGFGYDASRNLVSVTDGAAKTTTFTYDGAGRPLTRTTPTGLVTAWTYDPMGRVLTTTGPGAATTTVTYDTAGHQLTSADPTGAVTTRAYDSHGNLASVAEPGGATTTYLYNAAGDLTSKTGPGGALTTYGYGPLGRLATTTDPAGVTTTYGYDAVGNVTTRTDAAGKISTAGYDGLGRLTREADPLGGTSSYLYDGAGRLRQATDPLGKATDYAFGPAGRVSTITRPGGGVTTLTWTPGGRLASDRDPNNLTTTRGYDAAGRHSTTTDPGGGIAVTAYDFDGRPTSVTSPGGLATTFSYNPAGHLAQTANPTTGATNYTYTSRGEVATRTDAGGGSVAFGYDPAANLTSVKDAVNRTTAYTYDGRHNRLTRSNAAGGVTRWAWDLADRLQTITDPLNHLTTNTYDTRGRLSSTTDPTGRAVTVGYDDAGRVLTRAYAGGPTLSSSYDAKGRRNTRTDPTGTATFDYDDDDNLTSVLLPALDANTPEQRNYYSYDRGGRRTGATTMGLGLFATTVGTRYDPAGYISGLDLGGVPTAVYTHDADGHLLSEAVTGTTTSVTRSYQYSAGRLSHFSQQHPNHDPVVTDLGYDSAGRLVSESNGNTTSTYGYDLASQLTSVATGASGAPGATQAFTYGPLGNRLTQTRQGALTTTYVSDVAGRLTSRSIGPVATTYGYDDAGRNTSTDSPTAHQTTTYDRRGLPEALVTSTGLNPGLMQPSRTEQRRYDGDVHVVSASVAGVSGPAQTATFAWDTAAQLPQVQDVIANGVRSELAYGPNRAFSYLGLGAASAFSYDAHGSALQDAQDPSTAALVRSSGYDAFGQAATPDANGVPTFGYRGELTSGDLVNLRARDYDPSLSRFTTPDPRDGLDGTPVVANPYHYADNDPLNRVDPTGQRPDDNLLAFFETFGIPPITWDSIRQCGADVAGGGLDTLTFGLADSGHNGANKGSGCYRFGEFGANVGLIALNVAAFNAARDARELNAVRSLAKGAEAAEGALSDDLVLARGGANTADRFAGGAGVTTNSAGNLEGVSVNSGRTIEEAAQGIPHNQIGVSTAGDVRAAGGSVVSDPLEGNPGHCLIGGLTAEVMSGLFTPTIKNPCR